MDRQLVDLRRLRYFIAVCEHGGFSRASSSVGIAQPSLTRQIKLLEKELGFSLFHRTGRGAGPTEQGRLLLDRSKPHLDGIDEAVRDVRRLASKLSGDISVGVCPTIAPLFVEDLTLRMAAAHPGVRISIVEAYSGDLASMMSHGSIDMSLTYTPSDGRGVSFVELMSEPLILVTPPGPGCGGTQKTLEEVSRLRLILPSSIHELRRIIDTASAQRGIRLTPDIELDSLGAVKSMLLAGGARHATILPRNSVAEEIAAGRLAGLSIADPSMSRTIAVVRPHPDRKAPLTKLVATIIEQRAAGLRLERIA